MKRISDTTSNVAKPMSNSPMTKTLISLFAQPSQDVYSVFQSEGDPLNPTSPHADTSPTQKLGTTKKLGTWGFFGRMLEGTGIVAFSLTLALLTMTTGARAQTTTMLSSATGDHATATLVAMMAVFAIMLVMLRKTWRQTSKTIDQAPRASHRIG